MNGNANIPPAYTLSSGQAKRRRRPHFHPCGCTYLTPTFYDDHVMMPADCQYPTYHFSPFKYVASYEPDPNWPALEPSTPLHRTMGPIKSAFRTRIGPPKGVRFVEGDVAHCLETGKPLPPPKDPEMALRRWSHANACLAIARSVLCTVPEEEEQLPAPPPLSEVDRFIFEQQDKQVDIDLKFASQMFDLHMVEAIDRGILDLAMFVHTRKASGMTRIRNIVNRMTTCDGMVGSYTGDELIFAERAWSFTIIPPSKYADPATALSFSMTTPPPAYMVGANALTGGLMSAKTRQRILEDYEPDKESIL